MALKSSEDSDTHDPRFLTSVARGMSVLDCLSGSIGPKSLTEISQRTNLSIPTVQRLIASLIEAGYVEKSTNGKRYSLTLRTLDLLYYFLSRNTLAKSAWPYMVKLREQLQLDVSLSLPLGGSMIFLHRLSGNKSRFDNTLSGKLLPLHQCASGLCYLAAQSDYKIDGFISENLGEQIGLIASTDQTVLKTAIAECRSRGYASLQEEDIISGLVSLACPVRSGEKVVAGISVYAPLENSSAAELIDHTLPSLLEASRTLSSLPWV